MQRAISRAQRTTKNIQLMTDTQSTLFSNGQVLTVDPAFSIAEAVWVQHGRIVAVGNTADLDRAAPAGTRRIDLGGRTLMPGLIDCHLHIHNRGRLGPAAYPQAPASCRAIAPGG